MQRSPHLLMRTRQQDVFKTPSTSLSVSASRIFLSAKLLCKCSAQTLAHSQFMLIACTPTTPNLFPASLFFFIIFFASPNCNSKPHKKKNKEKRVLNSLHHSISHFANGLRLLVCVNLRVTSRAGCHLFSSRHFVCGLQHSSSSCYPLHGREQEAMLCWMRRVNILEVR